MRGGKGMDLAWALTIVGVCVVIALFIYALFGSSESSSSTTNNNYYVHARPSPQGKYTERFYGGDTCDSANYKVIFFHMDQCPHCVQFRPEWDKSVKRLSAMNGVCATEVSAKEPQKCKEYDVDGFPTIVLEDVRGGKKTVYDGPRTSDALVAFISQKAA
jgi:hypothetical protein